MATNAIILLTLQFDSANFLQNYDHSCSDCRASDDDLFAFELFTEAGGRMVEL